MHVSPQVVRTVEEVAVYRNVFAHHGGVADRDACRRVAWMNLQVGQKLEVSYEVADSCLESFSKVASALVGAVCQRQEELRSFA